MVTGQQFLDDEVRKLKASETDKQKSLIAQRYMIVVQRNDVLELRGTAFELTGSPAEWKKVMGFESQVPILFLDHPLKSSDVSMETSLLRGEEKESIFELDIIDSHRYTVRFVCVCVYTSRIRTVYITNYLNSQYLLFWPSKFYV